MKRCPQCGGDVTKGTFCNSCAKEIFYKEFFEKGIEEFEQLICSDCGRFFSKGTWHSYTNLSVTILKALRPFIDKQLTKPIHYELEFDDDTLFEMEDPLFYENHFVKNKYRCVAFMLTEDYEVEIPILVRQNQCPGCSKKDGEYFQSILQVRNATDEIVLELESLLAQFEKKNVHANKMIKQKTGVDLYMTDQAGTKSIAQKLQQKFGGEFSIHPQIFSRDKQTSKDVYRLTVLYRAPKFIIGDVIKDKFGHELEVTSIGSKVYGKYLKNNKKAHLDFRDLDPKFI